MTTPLMTSTLPTIVGMGVVSRTTDTMFGRRERNGRRRPAKNTSKRKGPMVHIGPRGGKYIMKRGRKVYI